MTIERHTTQPDLGFSDAVSAVGPGRLIHVSGNVGFGTDGKLVSGGMGAEARATFDNIERTLAEVGATMSQVVKIQAYLTTLDSYGEFAEARAERFGESLPASSAVQVAGLLVGAQIEIDAVAFIPES